jgi:hypothetical protein
MVRRAWAAHAGEPQFSDRRQQASSVSSGQCEQTAGGIGRGASFYAGDALAAADRGGPVPGLLPMGFARALRLAA